MCIRDRVHTVPQAVQEFTLGADEEEQEIEVTYHMGEEVRLWSEFDPSMYEMTVTLNSEENFADAFVESFGMREFKTSGTKFTINGITTFMRGEGNSAVFPLTGYPYMTKDVYKRQGQAMAKVKQRSDVLAVIPTIAGHDALGVVNRILRLVHTVAGFLFALLEALFKVLLAVGNRGLVVVHHKGLCQLAARVDFAKRCV